MSKNDLEKEIDKLFHKLEKYIDDFDFQSYIQPLIGDPDGLTEKKVENLNKALEYYQNHGVYLPLPNDPRYENIANYKDYEFTYCIAYEMAIRTDEFYKIKYLNMAIQDIQAIINPYLDDLEDNEKLELITNINNSFANFSNDVKSILFKNLNVDDLKKNISQTLTIMLHNLLLERDTLKESMPDLGILSLSSFLTQDMIVHDRNHEFELLYQNKKDLIIDDFDNGLNLLINHYLPKEKIYQKISDAFRFEKITIDKDTSIVIDDILKDVEPYYLVINSNIIQLSKGIPISILDLDLKKTLEKHYKKYQNIDTQPNFTRPTLHFINSNIINLPINLNLSKEEIINLAIKIKDDYDLRNSIIQTPMQLLGKKLEKAIEPKSLKKMPSKDARKLAFAYAFSVYDLYKVLTPIYENLERDFRKNLDNAKKYNAYDKLKLKIEISSILGISDDKVEYYNTLMIEYIKNKKYKELITGFRQDA